MSESCEISRRHTVLGFIWLRWEKKLKDDMEKIDHPEITQKGEGNADRENHPLRKEDLKSI